MAVRMTRLRVLSASRGAIIQTDKQYQPDSGLCCLASAFGIPSCHGQQADVAAPEATRTSIYIHWVSG